MSSSGSSRRQAVDYVVPLYHTPDLRPRIVAPPHVRSALRPTADWEEFASYGEAAECEVIVVPDLWAWEHWPDFVAHQDRYDLTPRVLVTTRDAECLSRSSPVVFHEVVWLEDRTRVDLGESVDRASSHGLIQQCRALFASADGLHPDLRNALIRTCSTPRAIRSVNDLASLADRDRRTISNWWTEFVGPAPAIRLKDLLDLILLLRAIHQRAKKRRWPQIRRELDVSTDVFRERTQARLGKAPNDLVVDDAAMIVRAFEDLFDGAEAVWPLPGDSIADSAS